MAGYIIPSDWDGVSYRCFQIQWPDSPQWISLLSGALANFYLPDVWDAATGNADEAAATGEAIINLNTVVPDFPPDCEDEMAQYFVAYTEAIGGLPAGAWTVVEYDVSQPGGVEVGDTGIFTNRQEIREPQYGLWLYTFAVGGIDPLATNVNLGIWTGFPALADRIVSIQTPNIPNALLSALLYFDSDVDLRFTCFHPAGGTYQPPPSITYLRGAKIAELA